MSWEEEDDRATYKVVLNHEEQYSIWPADRENAPGWRDEGTNGTKAECLAHIEAVWTDMRPLSLRKKREEDAQSQPAVHVASDSEEEDEQEVVNRLSTGSHPVVASVRPEGTSSALKACIERGYVHIRFTDTRGEMEIGVRLDREACRLTTADFDMAKGQVHLEGSLILDFVPIRCIADIDVATLQGSGRIERAQP